MSKIHAQLAAFLSTKFDELGSKPLTSWEKSIREYVFEWIAEFFEQLGDKNP